MKKRRVPNEIPVSQRDLANYLDISASMFHMSKSGKYMSHQLSSTSSLKLANLVLTHQQAQHTTGASLQKFQNLSGKDTTRLARTLSLQAEYAHAGAVVLKRRLEEMIAKEQKDTRWLNTIDHLLATLPKNKESANDRTWLESQQGLVLKRLHKNGPLTQLKLLTKIELEKAKADIYRNMQKRSEKGQL